MSRLSIAPWLLARLSQSDADYVRSTVQYAERIQSGSETRRDKHNYVPGVAKVGNVTVRFSAEPRRYYFDAQGRDTSEPTFWYATAETRDEARRIFLGRIVGERAIDEWELLTIVRTLIAAIRAGKASARAARGVAAYRDEIKRMVREATAE